MRILAAAQEFITPLSAGALSGEQAFTDLFDATTEFDVGHIRLARQADLVVVAPATGGPHGEDGGRPCRRSRIRCAARHRPNGAGGAGDEPAHVEPSGDAPKFCPPGRGRDCRGRAQLREMAEAGETGVGRMAEPLEIVAAVLSLSGNGLTTRLQASA